jgi:hypothetical protein
MTQPDPTTSSAPRRYNPWRATALVLALLSIALAVGWLLRERQLRIDHDQLRQDTEIQIKSLQKDLDAARSGAGTEGDDAEEPSLSPTTRPTTRSFPTPRV